MISSAPRMILQMPLRKLRSRSTPPITRISLLNILSLFSSLMALTSCLITRNDWPFVCNVSSTRFSAKASESSTYFVYCFVDSYIFSLIISAARRTVSWRVLTLLSCSSLLSFPSALPIDIGRRNKSGSTTFTEDCVSVSKMFQKI